MTKKNIILKTVGLVLIAVIIAALIAGNVLCFLNRTIITQYLCGFGLDEDSQESMAARESGNALAATVEEEGAVLLKNNGVLPLPEKSKVNVFGWAGSDDGFIPQGMGSGTGSRNDLVTFLGGLKEAGFEYNPDLAAAYDALNWSRVESGNYAIEATTDSRYKAYYGVIEADHDFYSDERMRAAKEYSDTAIVVIGRLLGEGNDYSKIQYLQSGANDETRKLQSLSEREEYMLDKVCKTFERVIVVLNTSNPIEMGFAEDEAIDAALFMGLPGTRGAIGLANLLCGKATPSGKVTDTWAYDISTAAAYATSGREGVGSYLDISPDTSLAARVNKYSDYLEDIYVGYKWYETADAEGFWNSNIAKLTWGIKNGYSDVVQYPFGFGLSYTQFRWTLYDSNYKNGDELPKDGKIELEVVVENIGTVPGKDVVEVYFSAPYTKGGIEKSSIGLLAFAKTALLAPGTVERVKLEIPVEDMKSYDCYDRNNNGFMGYELEGGDYVLSLRTDAHTLAETTDGRNTLTLSVPAGGYRYETDSVTGNPVKNQFTTYTNPTSGASSVINERAVGKGHSIDGGEEPTAIRYLTRQDFEGTFPYDKPANRNAGSKLKADCHTVTLQPVTFEEAVEPEVGSGASCRIDDLFGLSYEDPKWTELLSTLDIETMGNLITHAGFGTNKIESINKPATVDSDGPAGFNNSVVGQNDLKAVCYPSSTILASSWDWYMSYQVGRAIGIEANALGIQGWYGPGANLHRSVMGGRNFEYYSEDARLSGIICAYHVYGAKEQGLTAYVKHVAVNDSESGRNGAYKWLTEQNLRENYLLPFEILVKVGKGNAMMSSVDRIGSTRASSSYALLTSVLRNEWGFRGTVITDYYQYDRKSAAGDTIHDVDECVRAGNSMLLAPNGNVGWFDDTTSTTGKWAIQKSAHDILYTYVDTLNCKATATGLDKSSVITQRVDVFPWWVPVLAVIDVTAVALMGFWVFLLFRKKKKA